MTPDLPESLFLNPVLSALTTSHRYLAIRHGRAIRYRRDVSPFGALSSSTPQALCDLHSLLAPGELLWLPGLADVDFAAADLRLETTLPCLQMVLPEEVSLPEPDAVVIPLTAANAEEMVALTDIGFPGFFRPRTIEMGAYFGIRKEGQLIAMGGERFTLPGYSELSGLCTHPAHRGKGLAARIIWEIARQQRRRGVVSWLHVSAVNESAIGLYRKLGFESVRTVPLYRVGRIE